MAIFFPTIEKIKKFKVAPTAGELTMLEFLEKTLDDSFEVYFNPYLNGDRPDFVIMRKNYGVLIIEIKDWNLSNFTLNERKKWVYIPNGSIVKSPIDQVLRYKNNLFELHVDQLLENKIKDIRKFNVVSCALYFHCATQQQTNDLIVNPFSKDRGYQRFLYYNIDLIGKDSLESKKFEEILCRRYLIANRPSFIFTNDIYMNFKRILTPTIHMQSEGEGYLYTPKQKDIIYSSRLEQRVKGVFGSGKTTVLAARAVQAYKRALSRTNYPRILILTFNITLKNFIHDKLQQVQETFQMECFTIINYHTFINAELNNLNIEFQIPDDIDEAHIGDYLDRHYYSNVNLFEKNKDKIEKYDAILVDEIQDFKRPWMEIIKNYYRDNEGDYVLFGDVKQNIYGLPTQQRDVITNVRGVNELKFCFRSDLRIIDIAKSFQRNIFGNKYDVDDFSDNYSPGLLNFRVEDGYVNYMYLPVANTTKALYTIVRGNILNKAGNISSNDITVLGYTIKTLRDFDCYYRHACHESTNSMMETIEVMYMTHLNYINIVEMGNGWLKDLYICLKAKMFPHREILYNNDIASLRMRLATLFTACWLDTHYKDTFSSLFVEECCKSGITVEQFCSWYYQYGNNMEEFNREVFEDDYKKIRDNKKLHFWMNSGTIKISTINSFKGWESEVIFLIIEPRFERETDFNLNFDELLYTGLTRTRRNLIVINFGNEEYDERIRPLIEKVK